jgi:type IV secretory pathway TraG/TraD family ATPase VirD4
MRGDVGHWITEIQEEERASSVKLGTAQWMGPREAATKLSFPLNVPSGRIWIGENFDDELTPVGYGAPRRTRTAGPEFPADDRHVCLVSGARGGKGTGIVIPNLCKWPGSCVVIDPKGENATITAERRGDGSIYAHGMGQKVYNLDPFEEATLDPSLRARFNPLDAIDPKSHWAIDDAARIAASLVPRENQNDPFWEDSARDLIKGLILHVLTDPRFDGRRNLVSVRRLLRQGDWIRAEILRKAGDKDIPSAFVMLWKAMQASDAYDGIVSGAGEQFLGMADKTRSSILSVARTSTDFLDSIPMQRLLEASDFRLDEIKTDPKGVTIYLTLPRREMPTHFRWLRMMIDLAIGEMERIKGRPETGYPTLFVLDEFAGLRRMEVIEHAAAQAAGFGVKFFFIVQNFAQLKEVYGDGWQSFVGNSGLKLFFQIDDEFTRDYLSRMLGEREVTRETRSLSHSESDSRSTTEGTSSSRNFNTSRGSGGSRGSSQNYKFIFPDGHSSQGGSNWSTSSSEGQSTGESFSESSSRSKSSTSGWNEGLHKRPLLSSDEIMKNLARIDDPARPGYPGVVLAVIPGEHPLVARRVNYYNSAYFEGLFGPHPDHGPVPTLIERELLAAARAAEAAKAARALLPMPAFAAVPPTIPKSAEPIVPRFTWALGGIAVFCILAAAIPLVIRPTSVVPSPPPAQTTQENNALTQADQCSVLLQNREPVAVDAYESVTTEQLNVRRGPSARACPILDPSVIKPLVEGTRVRVISTAADGWKEIEVTALDGNIVRGFVLGKFLISTNTDAPQDECDWLRSQSNAYQSRCAADISTADTEFCDRYRAMVARQSCPAN